jgi:hypothetical protein
VHKCSSCFTEKPLSEFYEASNKRGKQYMCIDCYKSYFKTWREEQKQKPQTEFPTAKTCLDCGLEKPISQFGTRSVAKDKKMSYCKPCWRKQTQKAYRRQLENKNNA